MTAERSTTERMAARLAPIGVIVSLVFVALEVRQNTAAVRGATVQAVSQQALDLAMAGLDNPELRAAFETARDSTPEALTSEQKNLLAWFFASKLRADENRFRQVELGTLDADNFGQLSNNLAYRLPYFAEHWARVKGEYAPDFRNLVDEVFLPLSDVPLPEIR